MKTNLNEYLPTEDAEINQFTNEAECSHTAAGYKVWKPSEFLCWKEPAGRHFLLPACLTRGGLSVMYGQGGLGKSTLALQLAIHQILKRPWCGLETCGGPSRWLLLGNENSCERIQGDLAKTFNRLTPQEIEIVEEFLRIQAVSGFGDGLIELSNLDARKQFQETLRTHQPDVLVLDPIGNFLAGDISKQVDLKAGLQIVAQEIAAAGINPALQLLHHSRTGRANLAQGIGLDSANFGFGSKALFSAARAAINLMPGSETDDTQLVMSCAKASNAARFSPRGIKFDPDRCLYEVDPSFDLERWTAMVKEAKPESKCSVQDVVGAVVGGASTTAAIIREVRPKTGVSQRTVEERLKDAVAAGRLVSMRKGQYSFPPKNGYAS